MFLRKGATFIGRRNFAKMQRTKHNAVNNKLKKWKRIEEVITALTRNQVYGNVSWVRIPPLPPTIKTTNHGGFFVAKGCR